jgi:hypothetical protein
LVQPAGTEEAKVEESVTVTPPPVSVSAATDNVNCPVLKYPGHPANPKISVTLNKFLVDGGLLHDSVLGCVCGTSGIVHGCRKSEVVDIGNNKNDCFVRAVIYSLGPTV